MSHSDDPFFTGDNSDRTIIRPVPGGRRQDIERQLHAGFAPEVEGVPLENLGKINPLEGAASALLAIISRLFNSPHHANPAALKQQLVKEVKQFNIQAERAGYDRETIQDASYALCTTVDEAVQNTPWGQESGWGQQNLLSTFHQAVNGGDQFFIKLKELGQNPSKHLHLLELKYLCLALGFQGRYRIVDAGKAKLEQIREWLAQLIQKQKGTAELLLSPHWHGVAAERKTIMKVLPMWVFFAVASAVLLAIFLAFFSVLSAKSLPVKQMIAGLDIPPLKVEAKINEIDSLRKEFAVEIDKELVDVRPRNDQEGRTLIELRGDHGLFASGSDQVIRERKALVAKIATVLAKPQYAKRALLIIGHTDKVPIRGSIRFPDNVALSKARATAVKRMLTEYRPSLNERIQNLQGKGDVEPLDTGSSPDALARNRRVEIILK